MCEVFFFTDLLLRCVSCDLICRSGVVQFGHIMLPSAAPSGKRPADLHSSETASGPGSICILLHPCSDEEVFEILKSENCNKIRPECDLMSLVCL